YLHECDNELNKHLGVIRRKRCRLLGDNQKVPERDADVNIENKNLSGDGYETPEPTEQISPDSLNSSCSSYQPHTSSDDDETIVNKLKKFDYLVGPGKIEFDLNRDSIRWMVDDLDISSISELFRNNSIEKSQRQVLSVHEELALSHIFLIEEENNAGLKEYLNADSWVKINDQIRIEYPFVKLNDSIYEIWTNISKITCKQQNHLKLKKEVKTFLRQYTCKDELDESIIGVYENLINQFQTTFINEEKIEDTHVHKYVTPIVDPFFQEGKISIDWANRMSSSSTIAKRAFDPCLFGNKPDFVFKTTNQQKFIEVLIGEVKPPKSCKISIEADTVTIGKIMKSSLDLSIEYGIEDISVYGLQFAGFYILNSQRTKIIPLSDALNFILGYNGKFYGMDLNYDGVYRMMLLGQFQVPHGPESF
ncbi:2498_t:CDS:10, partial [Entrophospora sp. SA101]